MRYNALLNGLEITELKLSEVLEDNEDFRFDSDYFKKIYLRLLDRLSDFEVSEVGNFANVSDGDHSKFPENQTAEVRYLQAKDIKGYFVNTENNIRVSKNYFDDNKRSHITEENILLSIMGSVGDIAITPKGFEPSIANRAVAIISEIKGFNPYFVFSYLISREASLLTERLKTGGVQERINLDVLRKIKVPQLSKIFQTQIENFVKQAHAKLKESKSSYADAENLLLDTLGLQNWTPTTENISVKSFRESFSQAERIDSEYFHPEKQRMLDWLDKFAGKSVGFYVSSINALIDPSKGFSSEPVRNYDLTDALEIYLDEKDTVPSYELGSTKKTMKKGDIVVSRLRSYLKEIAIVDTPEESNIVGSSEFIVLRLKGEAVNAETLLVYLRSLPVQQILKWSQSGSNHPRFMEEDLLAVKLPDKILQLQNTFEIYIRDSIDKNRESKRLLEIAKRAVEIAIEQNEQIALRFVENAV